MIFDPEVATSPEQKKTYKDLGTLFVLSHLNPLKSGGMRQKRENVGVEYMAIINNMQVMRQKRKKVGVEYMAHILGGGGDEV